MLVDKLASAGKRQRRRSTAAAALLARDEAAVPVEREREHGEKRSECGVLTRHSGHHFRGRETMGGKERPAKEFGSMPTMVDL